METAMNRLLLPAFCALTALTACASRAPALHDPKAHFEADFKQADTDHDEALTPEEVALGMPSFSLRFDEIDLDKNGKLNFAEIWSYVQWNKVANEPPDSRRSTR